MTESITYGGTGHFYFGDACQPTVTKIVRRNHGPVRHDLTPSSSRWLRTGSHDDDGDAETKIVWSRASASCVTDSIFVSLFWFYFAEEESGNHQRTCSSWRESFVVDDEGPHGLYHRWFIRGELRSPLWRAGWCLVAIMAQNRLSLGWR